MRSHALVSGSRTLQVQICERDEFTVRRKLMIESDLIFDSLANFHRKLRVITIGELKSPFDDSKDSIRCLYIIML